MHISLKGIVVALYLCRNWLLNVGGLGVHSNHSLSKVKAILSWQSLSVQVISLFLLCTISEAHGAPVITAQPSPQSLMVGQQLRLTVVATGSSKTYQWYKNNSSIRRATSSSYTINSVTLASAGSYYVIVRNSSGSVKSNTALVTVTANAPTKVSDLNSSQYLSWIMKSVCVNAQGNLVSADPYYGCPIGTTIRKIQVGDAMPYNNFNQMKYQISDSFVLLDKVGAPLYLHNFDYFPFNEYNAHSASDGFDIYALNNNVVSYSNTKDGGGYGTTFFGANCTFGSGWVLFPTTNFLSPSQGFWPIAGNYWEQNGQAFFGSCPLGYSTNTLTSWEFKSAYNYGGINANPVKAMQTIVSYHGFETDDGVNASQNFIQRGHLEVYYFTREYGLTRWEVWTPVQQAILGSNKNECNGASTATYKNNTFVIQYCHDWSNVAPVTTSLIPEFPIENSNILQFSHFDSGLSDSYLGMGFWYRFGNSLQGNLINWSYGHSTQGPDAAYGSGFQYLSTNCGSTLPNGCGAPGSQAIYQDTPISAFCSSCTYLYGVKARTQSGTGTIQAAIQIINSSGQVLWQDVVQGIVVPDNGDGRPGEAESIYRSVQFVHKTAKFPSISGASFVRFLILPTSYHTFDIVDAWLNRFPERLNSVAGP